METILIKWTEKVDMEKEIPLPYYTKTRQVDCHWYKIVSDKQCLLVTDGGSGKQIGTYYAELALSGDNIQCTEAEFVEAYQRVKATIDNIAI